MNTYDLQITQGISFLMNITLTDINNNPIDLTALSAVSTIKNHYGDSHYTQNLNPQVITAPSGLISLSLSSTGTTGIPIGISFYDVILEASGNSSFLALAGKVYVSPSISFTY